MSWFQENKFLTGLLIVTLVVAGALGFLMTSAQTAFADAQSRYDELSSEFTRLQNSAPYPAEENVKKMQAVREQHAAAITALQKDLAAAELPLKPMTPEEFNDALDKAVQRVTTKAGEAGVGLKSGEKFYLGFDKYEREVPRPEAAAPLGRQLEAIELVINLLIDNRVSEVTDLKRETLAEEGVPAGSSPPARPDRESASSRSDKGDKGDKDKDLVTRNSFDLTFVASEPRAHHVINAIVASRQQFFIPRSVALKSERTEGPPRVDPNAPQPAFTPPPADPAVPPAPPGNAPAPGSAAPAPGVAAAPAVVKYVVGDEKLQVAMKIDVVDFSEPPPSK